MSTLTSTTFKKGLAYKGQTRIGDNIQVVFVRFEDDKYIVEYRGKNWIADLRQSHKGNFFQLIDPK